jgi:predicted ribosomally synthesized peptide with SipW-like signal peptide
MKMKKKLIIVVSLFALAVAIVGSGVLYAIFSDTQTASNNAFTSGTLMLQVGSASPMTEHITINSLKPGDSGNASSWQLQNTGTINGDLSVQVSAITNNENTVNSAEAAVPDTTPATGELGANLKVAFWVDKDNSGTWNTGDYYLNSAGTTVAWASGSSLPAAAYDLLNNYGGKTWTNTLTNVAPGSFGYFKAEYQLPSATGNIIQSDSSVFDIVFTLNQH